MTFWQVYAIGVVLSLIVTLLLVVALDPSTLGAFLIGAASGGFIPSALAWGLTNGP